MAVQRRAVVAAGVVTPALLAACGAAEVKTFPTLAAAARSIEALANAQEGWRSTGAWDLAQTLNHAAQSVEFSMTGFPELKAGWFRSTVGPAAFAVFEARGAMSHALDEPIPGAPPLPPGQPLDAAITRLLTALRSFEAHTGVLHPHFAYGALDKAQTTRAHLMHLANHWTLFVRTPT
jgi:Protein of unknown function (DUF1569)